MMLVPKVDGEFKGLKLPGEVVDKIYRTNAEKWFPGIVKSKPIIDNNIRNKIRELFLKSIHDPKINKVCHLSMSLKIKSCTQMPVDLILHTPTMIQLIIIRSLIKNI